MANLTYEEAIEAFEYRDGELFWRIKPHGSVQIGDVAGKIGKPEYKTFCFKQRRYKTHRVIYLIHHGCMPDEIDHINGNKFDNRIENLRPVTRSQNQCNKPMMKNNTSGHRCVSWDKRKQAWHVRVTIKGTNYFYGYFNDLEIAALIANEARAKLHGEFARMA
jgi:hypothetical protein